VAKYFENDYLNLTTYCTDLAGALSNEFKQTSASDLTWSFLEVSESDKTMDKISDEGALVHVTTVFRAYADWSASIGESLLNLATDENDPSGDWWATSENPLTRNLISLLCEWCIKHFSVSSEAYRKQYGYGPGRC
jgi:hypothetical protein